MEKDGILRSPRPEEDASAGVVFLPASYGEAADKITILELKQERIRDAAKLASIRAQLNMACRLLFDQVERTAAFEALFAKLKTINGQLWESEEQIRRHETEKTFDETFIQLARSIYRLNDGRARIKRQLDALCGSSITEEKSYPLPADRADGVPEEPPPHA